MQKEAEPHNNDERILNCCLFYHKKGHHVELISDDTNLRILSNANGISAHLTQHFLSNINNGDYLMALSKGPWEKEP